MLVDVVRLRDKGMRLRKGELEVAVRGQLALEDDPGTGLSFKRQLRVAHLYTTIGVQATRQEALPPIFDAQVIKIEGPTVTITGTELSNGGGRVTESAQVWRCTLVG